MSSPVVPVEPEPPDEVADPVADDEPVTVEVLLPPELPMLEALVLVLPAVDASEALLVPEEEPPVLADELDVVVPKEEEVGPEAVVEEATALAAAPPLVPPGDDEEVEEPMDVPGVELRLPPVDVRVDGAAPEAVVEVTALELLPTDAVGPVEVGAPALWLPVEPTAEDPATPLEAVSDCADDKEPAWVRAEPVVVKPLPVEAVRIAVEPEALPETDDIMPVELEARELPEAVVWEVLPIGHWQAP